MSFNPRNILVIDFGQLGDVVLSLPALRAIREKFPIAQITVAAGKPSSEIVAMSGYADAIIEVDRVAMRDGFKPLSILKIWNLVKDVRRRQFDFVIVLHSFSETNLLGFLSGARHRLFARRRGRSLDFLANFIPQPPLEETNRTRHQVDRYLDVLKPLEIPNADRIPRLPTHAKDDAAIDRLLRKSEADAGAPLIGLFPGAGHEMRRWPAQRFAQLAETLIHSDGARPVVLLGPEEQHQAAQIKSIFPPATVFLERLTIPQLAVALARLSVFVSNDTGPMHIAAAVGTPIVVLLDRRAPDTYVPLSDPKRIVYSSGAIPEISVADAYAATRELLGASRTASLFAS